MATVLPELVSYLESLVEPHIQESRGQVLQSNKSKSGIHQRHDPCELKFLVRGTTSQLATSGVKGSIFTVPSYCPHILSSASQPLAAWRHLTYNSSYFLAGPYDGNCHSLQ
jgi:hypothetical protein